MLTTVEHLFCSFLTTGNSDFNGLSIATKADLAFLSLASTLWSLLQHQWWS